MRFLAVTFDEVTQPKVVSVDAIATEQTMVRIQDSIIPGEFVLYIDNGAQTVIRVGKIKDTQISIESKHFVFTTK